MFSILHEEIFRQTVAAYTKEEVDIACDILVAMHPAQYFNALSRNYLGILKTNEQVGSIYMERYHEYQRMIGNESQIVNIPRNMVDPTISVEDPEPMGIEQNEIRDIQKEGLSIPVFLSTKSDTEEK